METKVVRFPKRNPRREKTCDDLAKDVRAAVRRLRRAILQAERAGLRVDLDFPRSGDVAIIRSL